MTRLRLIPALLLLALSACGGDERGNHGKGRWGGDKKDEISDWRVLVEAAPVVNGTVARELVTHGSLESEAMADITPEAGGVVREILVEEGDSVRRGAVLAVLSNPSLEAGSERARVELSQARRRFEQAQTLHGRGAISDSEFQEAEDAFAIARAGHREATGSAGFTRLTSPIDGTVAVRNVRLGELAGGAQRAFQVVDLSRLRVIVNLSEGDLEDLHLNQPVTLAGTYDKDARATGKVLRISPVVDETSGTVRVTIAVNSSEEAEGKLRPGQYVEVRIEVDRHDNVMTIPRRAVYWQDGAPIAWKIVPRPDDEDEDEGEGDKDWKRGDSEKSGWFANLFKKEEEEETEKTDPWEGVPRRIVERVSLNIGFTDSDNAEIVEGLTEGDQVVSIGGDNLRPEADIKLPGDPNPKKSDNQDKTEAADGEGDPE